MKSTNKKIEYGKYYSKFIQSNPPIIQKNTEKIKNKKSKTEEAESEASLKVEHKIKII